MKPTRFSVLEDQRSMECGDLPLYPTSPTPKNIGQNQTPKTQRTKPNK